MAASICPECGKSNLDNAEFCQFCNSALGKYSEKTGNPVQSDNDQNGVILPDQTVISGDEPILFPDMKFSDEDQNQMDSGEVFGETEDDFLRLLQNLDPESIKLEDLLTGEGKAGDSDKLIPGHDLTTEDGILKNENENSEYPTIANDETSSAANASLDWLHSLSDKSKDEPFMDGLQGSGSAETLINGLPAWLAENGQNPASQPLSENYDGFTQAIEQKQLEEIGSKWLENTGELLPIEYSQSDPVGSLLDKNDTDLFPQINSEGNSNQESINSDYLPSDGKGPNQSTDPKQDDFEAIPDWLAVLQTQDLNNQENGISANFPVSGPSEPQDGLPDWFINLQNKLDELSVIQGEQQTAQIVNPESETNNVFYTQTTHQEHLEMSSPDLEPVWTSPFISEILDEGTDLPSTDTKLEFESDSNEDEKILSRTDEETHSEIDSNFSDKRQKPAKVEDQEFSSLLEILRSSISEVSENEFGELPEASTNSPLSGFDRVLPSTSAAKSPDAGLIQVTATDSQNAHAHLLKNLILSENTPINFPVKRESQTNHRLRWLITAVLVVSIFVTTITRGSLFPTPVLRKNLDRTNAFFGMINGLADHGRVLFVTDYQSSFAGEIELLAIPVINHLKAKNSSISFITTTPTGIFLSDRLIEGNTAASLNSIKPEMINLGYLPGGASGIRAFSEKTQGQAEPKYAAIIVATDDPDTGRLWIEQIQPQGNTIPILMIVSTQAEMMINPYLSSFQIGGILSGLEGAVVYEKLTSVSGKANLYWNSFGIGIIIFELFIIIGIFWSLTLVYTNRRKHKEGSEE